MSQFSSISMPASSHVDVRIAWAGDRFQDLIEGVLSTDQGWYIWNALVGWTDICTTEEKRQYLQMAKIFEEYLRNQ